ncbi:leucine-rich repeat domain-containing protein [Candidatus Palauibacter sp.]|uniref:leucine-rich repeat domain-containing protein n=1 Tax=Candidatus Palauibacter sp. TaxID=3101350 RepID=UPI003B5C9887
MARHHGQLEWAGHGDLPALQQPDGRDPPEIGHFPELRNLNLGRNQLRGEIPPEIGLLTELRELGLQDLNDLTGSIPAEIGNLANLEELWLYNTGLAGAIPPELGNLASLRLLILHGSRFSGPIPEELGRLTELEQFWLWNNMIDGPLPASLGGLENLRVLVLGNNRLTGPIPAELGQLGSLRTLELDDNMLDGSLPPEFGDLVALRSLHVRYNPDLSGPLPDELTALAALEDLQAGGTGLCAPTDPEFRAWLNEVVTKWRVRSCGTESHAEAHLIQATQSPEFPVPLVAGRSALLRVFVMSEQETMETIPPVRAKFFVDGAEVHSVDISAGTSAIPMEVQVGELDLSANAAIPGEVIQPGLEMVVEVDPDGTVDPALGVAKRIPAEGRAAVEVQEVPPLYLTLVPFVSTADGNQGAVTFVDSATPGHELLFEARTLLPVGAFEITRHPSVTVSSNDIVNMLDHMEQIRTIENGTGHWMGLTPNPTEGQGIAYLGSDGPNLGKVSVSNLKAGTIAHELGHNLNLTHAPCGGPAGVDWTFPYADARTGVWGYDPRDGGSMVPPDRADLMSYCEPVWISDYYFTNALRFRLVDPVEVWPAALRTLIVSGAAAADGTLHLEPAFVVETTPVVPTLGGPYQLTGRRADGSELFSLSFAMQEVMDGDGRFRFTFALPVRAEWESELASLALAGPGGTVEMREGSEPPTVIMRDPVTGHVRAILRDLPAGDLSAGALDALAPEPGLEIMVSGGLPAAADWKR